MKTQSIFKIAGAGLAVAVTFCTSNYFGRMLTRNSSNDPSAVVQKCSESSRCEITNSYIQPDQPGTFSPEIVFVGDTSGSMDDNFDKIAVSLPQWLRGLQAQGFENFCVGYMPAHAGKYSGLYYAPDNYPKCICYEDHPDINYIADTMAYILKHPVKADKNDNGSSTYGGGEEPLLSLHNGLTNWDKIVANQNAGCFRQSYTLVPLLISDENDAISAVDGLNNEHCAGKTVDGIDVSTVVFDNSVFPAAAANGNQWVRNPSTAPNFNPIESSCTESQARLKYYSNPDPDPITGKYTLKMTPESIANELVAYNGTLPSFGTGMGYKPGVKKAPFWGGIEFASEFGQEIANLQYSDSNDQVNLDKELNKITTALTKQLSFHFSFDLQDKENNSVRVCESKVDELVVKVDGKVVSSDDYSLTDDRSRITFDREYSWDFNDEIEINFVTCN